MVVLKFIAYWTLGLPLIVLAAILGLPLRIAIILVEWAILGLLHLATGLRVVLGWVRVGFKPITKWMTKTFET